MPRQKKDVWTEAEDAELQAIDELLEDADQGDKEPEPPPAPHGPTAPPNTRAYRIETEGS